MCGLTFLEYLAAHDNTMTSFLNACEIDGSLQLAIEGPDLSEPELRLLYQPFAVIGRDPRADVYLPSTEVSRRHVYLQIVEGRAFWVDLESRTGTRAEKAEQKSGWLEGNQTLSLGSYTIRKFAVDHHAGRNLIDNDPLQVNPLIAQSHSRLALPDVILEFMNGPSQSLSWPVHRVLSLIGSAPGCKFRLTDRSVSRFHASLVRTPDGIWIVDLLGKLGITINEVPIRSGRLLNGDVVGIGRYQMRCRLRSPEGAGAERFSGRLAPTTSLPSGQGSLVNPFSEWVVDRGSAGRGDIKVDALQLSQRADGRAGFTGTELVSTAPNMVGQLNDSSVTESVLVPLVNQFGAMQQQMLDQFQQAIAMMVQMFGTMHRDQMDLIHKELNRLNELTDEIQSLKVELASRSQDTHAPEDLGTSSRSQPQQVDKALGSDSATERAAAVKLTTPGLQSKPSGRPRSPAAQASEESPKVVPTSRRDPHDQPIRHVAKTPATSAQAQHKVPHVSPDPTPPKGPRTTVGGAPPNPIENRDGPPSGVPDPPTGSAVAGHNVIGSERETIAWLHQRMASLQTERESRWQKILKLLPGGS